MFVPVFHGGAVTNGFQIQEQPVYGFVVLVVAGPDSELKAEGIGETSMDGSKIFALYDIEQEIILVVWLIPVLVPETELTLIF